MPGTDKSDRGSNAVTDQEALDFHSQGRPGKLEITPTKPMASQRDLSLAYSPGVAVPVKAIAADPQKAFDYTARGNMVAGADCAGSRGRGAGAPNGELAWW